MPKYEHIFYPQFLPEVTMEMPPLHQMKCLFILKIQISFNFYQALISVGIMTCVD